VLRILNLSNRPTTFPSATPLTRLAFFPASPVELETDPSSSLTSAPPRFFVKAGLLEPDEEEAKGREENHLFPNPGDRKVSFSLIVSAV